MRYMDLDSLGGAAALVSTWADMLNEDYGWNMYYPHVVATENIDAALKLARWSAICKNKDLKEAQEPSEVLFEPYYSRVFKLKTYRWSEKWVVIERFSYAEDSKMFSPWRIKSPWKFPIFTPEPI